MSKGSFPPGPKETPIIGELGHLGKDFPYFLLQLGREYGDLATFHLGPRPYVLVNRPDLIERVLVTDHARLVKGSTFRVLAHHLLGQGLLTSEGDFHLRQRRLAQKAFNHERINAYAAVMTRCAQEAVAGWTSDETRDVGKDMMHTTLRIAGETLFSTELGGDLDVIASSLTEFMKAFPSHLLPGEALRDHLPVPSTNHLDHARRSLDEVVYRIIGERRRNPGDRGDLLSMLMASVDEDGSSMSDEQLRDEAVTILLAAHETTATALTWAWYLLSLNPEVRRQMQAEVDGVLQGRAPALEDYPKLAYTRNVFLEAMRLYPPVWSIERETVDDYTIEGYTLPRGTSLMVSPLVTHHDARFWPTPLAFDPARWTPERSAGRHRFAYYPFSGGQRLCMGEQFATLEATLILATIAQRWELSYEDNRPANYLALITLRPRHPMTLRLHARAAAVAPAAV